VWAWFVRVKTLVSVCINQILLGCRSLGKTLLQKVLSIVKNIPYKMTNNNSSSSLVAATAIGKIATTLSKGAQQKTVLNQQQEDCNCNKNNNHTTTISIARESSSCAVRKNYIKKFRYFSFSIFFCRM
jgi:hypothetical protein